MALQFFKQENYLIQLKKWNLGVYFTDAKKSTKCKISIFGIKQRGDMPISIHSFENDTINHSSFKYPIPNANKEIIHNQENQTNIKQLVLEEPKESTIVNHRLCIILELLLLGYFIYLSISAPILQYFLVGIIPCLAITLIATYAKPTNILVIQLHSILLSIIASLPATLNPQISGHWMLLYLILPTLILYRNTISIILASSILSCQWLLTTHFGNLQATQLDQLFIFIVQICIVLFVLKTLKKESAHQKTIRNIIEQIPSENKNISIEKKLRNHFEHIKQISPIIFMLKQDNKLLKDDLLNSKNKIQEIKNKAASSNQDINDLIQCLIRETRISESTLEICEQLKKDCFDVFQQTSTLIKNIQQLQTNQFSFNDQNKIFYEPTEMVSSLSHKIKDGIDSFEGYITRIHRATHQWVEDGQKNQRNSINILNQIEQILYENEQSKLAIESALEQLERASTLLKPIELHLSQWPMQQIAENSR